MPPQNSSPFLSRWLNGERPAGKSRAKAAKKSSLHFLELESRLAPATLPQPTIATTATAFTVRPNGSNAAPAIQHSLQVAVHPDDSTRQVAVGVSGNAVVGLYSMDGGGSWKPFLNNTDPALRFRDVNVDEANNSPTEATRLDATSPAVAFDRNGRVFVTHIQRTSGTAFTGDTAAVGSGVVVVAAYTFDPTTGMGYNTPVVDPQAIYR